MIPSISEAVISTLPVSVSVGSSRAVGDGYEKSALRVLASDRSVDRYGRIVEPDGWVLDAYLRNPVILNMHRYDSIEHCLGSAEESVVTERGLEQVWRFAETPLGQLAQALYAGRFLRAASVAWLPIKWEMGGPKDDFIIRFTKQELIEVSAVTIPANRNALRRAVQKLSESDPDLAVLSGEIDRITRLLRCP